MTEDEQTTNDARVDGQPVSDGRPTATVETVPVRIELIQGLRDYVEWHGAAHTDECPEDDTCSCICKPCNDAVDSILGEAFDAQVRAMPPSAGAAAVPTVSDWEHKEHKPAHRDEDAAWDDWNRKPAAELQALRDRLAASEQSWEEMDAVRSLEATRADAAEGQLARLRDQLQALEAQWRKRLHDAGGQPIHDMAGHARGCVVCRTILMCADQLAALRGTEQ